MTSAATLKFNYSIFDESGNRYYSNNMRIGKEEAIDLKISTDNLPNGYIFHKFTFDDGSVYKVKTIKQ